MLDEVEPTHIYLDEIDSTNEELKRRYHSDNKPENYTVISAGHQTAGKGRSGHQWKSPEHDSVATSMMIYPELDIQSIPRLTILSGMAVAAAIERLYQIPTQLKWPNDVLIRQHKVCGILCEMEASNNQADYVIIGIGVNVHQREFPEEIREIATSVDLELEASSHRDMDGNVNHAKASRQAIDHQIWREFLRLYQKFKETEDLTLLLEEYNQRLINRNKTVRVLNPKGEYEGTSLGIDAQGNLLVQKKDDSIVKVDSGEVSVRGVYGYV